MARAEITDFYQGFRFHVTTVGSSSNGLDFLDLKSGFQSVTIPEYTLDSVEYREGTMKYTQKYPGVPSTNELTLSKGVSPRASQFYDWVRIAIEGGNYRTDLLIKHFHRADPLPEGQGNSAKASRTYLAMECFPTRVKVAGDLDSQSSDVSLEEIDLVFEKFELVQDTITGV